MSAFDFEEVKKFSGIDARITKDLGACIALSSGKTIKVDFDKLSPEAQEAGKLYLGECFAQAGKKIDTFYSANKDSIIAEAETLKQAKLDAMAAEETKKEIEPEPEE